ncbi:amidase signature domain-containing protein [Lasiosphaeria ovina]|uniref:Amidase signature domain-containing protein n=1 Tax=Lasiosphaeria ovina TaxID=92902 RepID=A0AAE0JRA2_9PEZI|nr:amidase signature domain-containing protein [Lasiosphaeria ovina]
MNRARLLLSCSPLLLLLSLESLSCLPVRHSVRSGHEELLLTASAGELQALLRSGDLTSVQLVKACLGQIAQYGQSGPNLRAIVSTPPEKDVLSIAERLDKERAAGKVRGPFHGIPIIVKLLDKGLIILGKASLTFQGDNITSGWSALNGQTQSAYIEGGVKHREMRLGHTAPGGSSSGSAVGVSSAGYSPVSIRTEAHDSLCTPASRAALYGMKPTVGSTPMDGIFVISTTFDTVGAMAKSVDDLATLNWSGLRLGFVDPDKWWLPSWSVTPIQEVNTQISRKHQRHWRCEDTIFDYGPRGVVAKYLETRDDSSMKTLEDIAKFNIDHADLELPEAQATLQREALENGVQRLMKENRLDAIIGPTDGPLASISAAIVKTSRNGHPQSFQKSLPLANARNYYIIWSPETLMKDTHAPATPNAS